MSHDGRMKTNDQLVAVLAERVHELERRISKQRRRIDTLERTKRRQRNLIAGLYYNLRIERVRVRSARMSRDMWRHRCMVETERN